MNVSSLCQCSPSAHPFDNVHLTLIRSLDNNRLEVEGAEHVANALAVNQTLTSVEYGTTHSTPRLPYMHTCQQPLSPRSLLQAASLAPSLVPFFLLPFALPFRPSSMLRTSLPPHPSGCIRARFLLPSPLPTFWMHHKPLLRRARTRTLFSTSCALHPPCCSPVPPI